MSAQSLKLNTEISRENPFFAKARGNYFFYHYHYKESWFSGLINKPQKHQKEYGSNVILRRIVLKKNNGDVLLYYKGAAIAHRRYYVFYQTETGAVLHKVFGEETNNYTPAMVEMRKLKQSPTLIAEEIPKYRTAPNSKNKINPFELSEEEGNNFFYLTGRGPKNSFLCDGSDTSSLAELGAHFPMGYTNLWYLRRLDLYSEQKWTAFGKPKPQRKQSFALMNELQNLNLFESYEEALDFTKNYIKKQEQKDKLHCHLLVAQLIENIYWH